MVFPDVQSCCLAVTVLKSQPVRSGITGSAQPALGREQGRHAHVEGVQRVLLANQLVGKGNFALIASLQQRDPSRFACVVTCRQRRRAGVLFQRARAADQGAGGDRLGRGRTGTR